MVMLQVTLDKISRCRLEAIVINVESDKLYGDGDALNIIKYMVIEMQ